MMDQPTNTYDEQLEVNFDDTEIAFKTSSFIQNDLLLSLIYFGLILFSPLLLWNHVDHLILFTWQGAMVAVTAARWLCRYAYAQQKREQIFDGFWSGVLVFLTLLEGLGWGISGAVLFPIDSLITTSLIALLLMGIGGIGAISYSARMLIAIPYLFCVISPFISRLYFSGGSDELMIAGVLGLLTIMFCFAADRINITLSSALEIDSKDEEVIILLEDKNQQLQNSFDTEKKRSRNLELQLSNNSTELKDAHQTVEEFSEELHLLSGKSLNLLADIASLKKTRLDNNQLKFIEKIEETAFHLSSTLNVTEENNLDLDTSKTKTNNQALKVLPTPSKNEKLILIVDDDKEERDRISTILDTVEIGYESVENVPAALAVLCEAESHGEHFELIIANMWMADMDGLGFAECLGEDADLKDIKFILLNGGELPSKQSIEKENINAVLPKPIDEEKLIKTILTLSEQTTESQLPTSIGSAVNDAIQISNSSKEQSSPDHYDVVIDQDVINELRSSSGINFVEVVNNFLEEAPTLIDKAKNSLASKKYSEISLVMRELSDRSSHMGATKLVNSAKAIEKSIENQQVDMIHGMIQSIDAELVIVESTLLAELTNGSVFFNSFRH